jgi:alanyl-tRNA synthetase
MLFMAHGILSNSGRSIDTLLDGISRPALPCVPVGCHSTIFAILYGDTLYTPTPRRFRMTSTEIRQSFLDFFHGKKHTIVPSSSLLPDSPNLLFTNAGMNQFVPIFLGQRAADVSKWAGALPGMDTRAADTQKCIRAGGKHNDLEDVGLDTYHHTFFEMLGNWSFGDYFKKEAIEWAWELVVTWWKFPPQRLYATVYNPGPGDPSEFDQEAWNHWAALFTSADLDPAVHIVNGNKKDNFWMMGDTGPCGPCSELHVDLTPAGDTGGKLVNQGSPLCIEIWNLVFIQFNANADGTFSPLPARHVDTGMGFERVTSILQCTKGFTDFTGTISNYETDIFRPIFDEIERISGKRYASTLPATGATGATEQEKTDVAFRVLADHIRTLSFAVADGIQPGNNDRNYVLRRILRRAVKYGRALGLTEPFFYKLVDVLARTMGGIFPELRAKQKQVEEVLKREEEAFNKTLDKGIALFEAEAAGGESISGKFAFRLYDEQGFPLDLTELLARERGLSVDVAEFESLMYEQRDRARKAQKKEIISISEDSLEIDATEFLGYDFFETEAGVKLVSPAKNPGEINVILDRTVLYGEMGGQVGDIGVLHIPAPDGAEAGRLEILDTQKKGALYIHRARLAEGRAPEPGEGIRVSVRGDRRRAIQRHHTVTHLLHWALHEVVSKEAAQKGSFVGPEKLTFDFNSPALTAQQVHDIERLVNEKIIENAPVAWKEVPFAEIKGRPDIMQFFGDKYGDVVRVVQIGGVPGALNGYSMELCAGTHARGTGEIGLFRILSEGAVAAGVRRFEAVAGLPAYDTATSDAERLKLLAGKLNAPLAELEKKLDAMLAHQKEIERQLKSAQQAEAAGLAKTLLTKARKIGEVPVIIEDTGALTGEQLQSLADALKGQFAGVLVLAGTHEGQVSLLAAVSPDFTGKFPAGKIIQQIAPIVGGKGGGRPDNARGAGKDASKLRDALAAAESLLN